MRRGRVSSQGFTLIELIAVIAIVGFMAVTAYYTGGGWIAEWQRVQRRQSALTEGSIALNRMIREIRKVRNRASITAATPTQFAFRDADGHTVDFSLSGSTLYRSYDNSGKSILAEKITRLTFVYYGADLTKLDYVPSGADSAAVYIDGYTNVRLVRIYMTIADGGEVINFRTAVAPVNLQLE